MIVLAFDPSTTRTGWALCERVAGRFERLRSGAIKTTPKWAYLERIAELTDAVCDLFDTMPDDLDVIAVEDPGRSRHAIKAAFSVYGVACSWYGAGDPASITSRESLRATPPEGACYVLGGGGE